MSSAGSWLPPRVSLPLRARFGRSREPELPLVARFVRPGDTVVDIGAHKGVYTHLLARLVGADGHVVAYEPQPILAQYLGQGLRGRLGGRVELRTVALSDAPGVATLTVPFVDGEAAPGEATLRTLDDSGSASYEVRTVTLDSEPFPGRVAFMKIDVEGFELTLLRGGRSLLAQDRPTLLVEVEHRHAGDATESLAELVLDGLSYEAFEKAPGGDLTPTPRDLWARGVDLNQRSDGRYVNNFFLLPRDRSE